jgi:hypothetical protein
MTDEIAINVSGFLFLFILASYLVMMGVFGYRVGLVGGDADAELQKIHRRPGRFGVGLGMALVEHLAVIALAILLFIAFGSYSLILGIAWLIFRIGEGLIVIYNENDYRGLLKMAGQYAAASGAERQSLANTCLDIFRRRDSRFNIGMIAWSLGTLAFSIMLVANEATPLAIGWLGIAAGIVVFLCNCAKLAGRDYKVLFAVGALLPISFEISIGVWLTAY